MKISIIVAASNNWAIGIDDKLPWHLADDLRNFKQTTLNKPIIMGRKTFESIGKPLPQRQNIVISKTTTKIAGCQVFSDPLKAVTALTAEKEIMVIGGGAIYETMLPATQRIYLTKVRCIIKGDTFFPELDMNEWKIISRQQFQKNSNNDHPFEIMVLDRI
jgi:dihydrofolate reductase